MLAFPVTFVLTDVLNEFYGPLATRRVTYLGLGAALLGLPVINVALAVPVSPESPLSDGDFAKVFRLSRRLYIASLTAYVVGQLIDIKTFTRSAPHPPPAALAAGDRLDPGQPGHRHPGGELRLLHRPQAHQLHPADLLALVPPEVRHRRGSHPGHLRVARADPEGHQGGRATRARALSALHV
jgi:hypothetical protein